MVALRGRVFQRGTRSRSSPARGFKLRGSPPFAKCAKDGAPFVGMLPELPALVTRGWECLQRKAPLLPPEADEKWGTRCWVVGKRLAFNEFDFEREGHFFADHQATGFENRAPSQAEILAIDFCCRRQSDARVAPGVFLRWGRAFDFEGHVAGYAVDVKVAGDLQLAIGVTADVGGLEQ